MTNKAPQKTLSKTYNPKEIESHWYQHWDQSGYFKSTNHGEPYSIILPPPNVTGSLHMGHGFQTTLMDALIRYHKMSGRNVLWQAGTDHAGIATQMVVERQLASKNLSRHDLGRDKFIEKIWEWKSHSGDTIKNQLKRMGAALDWSRDTFTMDPHIVEVVKDVFVKLFDEGLIYRGLKLVNWDPVFHTAISDLEVINKEVDGQLWYINYPLTDGTGHITIATTRPETMLADTAVAVHPDDERYQSIVGKTLNLPLTDRTIPIIADETVVTDFGTGCVKITPAHDFNDYDMGQRHNLPMINILTKDAKINEHAPKAYQGLDRFDARKQIVDDIKSAGLLEKIEKHKINLPIGDRSNAVIEPYLTRQWFVKAQPLAEPAIAAVKRGEISFIPENWRKTYFQWLEEIQDWCISRQLWWGHRIPAWYDDKNNVYVGLNEADVRSKYQLSEDVQLRQDDDVLDTWFSSALWPFATLGWHDESAEFNTFYPTNVLVTGFDIIFFWVARMVMMGLKFTGKIPFKEVYITGLIRDRDGNKMSKSKGNILDPIDLIDGIDLKSLIAKRTQNLMQAHLKKEIEEATRDEFPNGIAAHGTDALRFTYCALATTGRDIRFDMGRIEGYRNFTNKIWNATRYILMQYENSDIDIISTQKKLSLADEWILARLQHTIKRIHKAFREYRFDWIAQAIYEFTWYEYCDWYLELTKPVLFNDEASNELKCGALHTLLTVLETLLRLMHPLMPFISEEIWQQIRVILDIDTDSILLRPYPTPNEKYISPIVETNMGWIQEIITAIRNIRGEMQIAPSKQISVIIKNASETQKENLNQNKQYLLSLAKVQSYEWAEIDTETPGAATALVGDVEVLIPLAGLIDKDAELNRLQKEIAKLEKNLAQVQGRLQNKNFINKAPEDVVSQVKQQAQEAQDAITTLQDNITRIQQI